MGKERSPPFTCKWIETVNPVGGTGPAPAVKDVIVFVLNKEGLRFQLISNVITGFVLDMGINDDNELPTTGIQLLLHRKGIGEVMRIPCEILLAVRVFNV